MNRDQQIQDIVDEVRRRTAAHAKVPERDVFESGLCLYVSHFLLEVLREKFRDPSTLLLQAGTALWQFRNHEHGMTHVGYEWSDDLDFNAKLASIGNGGVMPEFHSWVVLRHNKLVIDLCTPRFRHIASALGHETVIEIPDRVWCGVEDLPATCRYQPTLKASGFAFACLLKEFGDLPYFPQARMFVESCRRL